MFKAWYSSGGWPKQVTVYDVSYDSNGAPFFLIYIEGEWIRKSAKYFIQYDSSEE